MEARSGSREERERIRKEVVRALNRKVISRILAAQRQMGWRGWGWRYRLPARAIER
jgi:hypothetical protein